MSARPLQDRAVLLFIGLAAFFCANALLAELIGVKIFALEDTLGIAPLDWNLFGQTGSLSFTAGTLLWPVVFVMTDTINEFFGKRGVRFISWLAAGLICYGFLFAYAAISLAPASWWVGSMSAHGVPDYQAAFAVVFGQGMWTIAGSLVAFMVGQLIDSFVVIWIAFVLGPQQWPTSLFLAVSSVNYVYKMAFAIALIPLLYLMRHAITQYLGAERARQLRADAAAD